MSDNDNDNDIDDNDCDDDYDPSFVKRLEELRNMALLSDGAVVGRDFLEVILRHMEFSYALSQRAHRDV